MRLISAGFVAALAVALGLAPASRGLAQNASEATPPAAIRVVHEAPTNPAHQSVFERIRADATFAKSRDVFTLFRLPREITFRTRSCSGRGGAWYFEGQVTVCYEYLQNVLDNAASDKRPDWVSAEGALSGAIADVVIHEGAHAVFEFYRTPLMGREEDAADQFATFLILNLFGADAGAMIRGVAYSYLNDAAVRNFAELPTLQNRMPPSRAYGGAHSTALQRLFSVVCHASGFDPDTYKDLVVMSELPSWRAGGCVEEYKQIAHAFHTLIGPRIDHDKAKAMFPQAKLLPAE